MIFLNSDNASGMHPEILKALGTENNKFGIPYGGDETTEEAPDIDELRKKFEAEENIDFETSREEDIQKEEIIESVPQNGKDAKKTNFHELLNLAETQVQVVASQDGRKIYQVDK